MKTYQKLLIDGIKLFHNAELFKRDEIIPLLEKYIAEIELFNPIYGLVKVENTEELIVRHILDSLAPAEILSGLLYPLCENTRPQIADAGSGAGLPGIPLAAALSNCDFTLIERMKRRTGFLLNAKAVVNLPNVTIEEGELEKTPPERFHLITFRAFKPINPPLLKSLFRALKPGGIIAAYKGRKEKIEQEIHGLENVNIQIIPYSVPFLDEPRHLLVITK
jgi:16S rRNA (guanine527-N7)-methyltransferase